MVHHSLKLDPFSIKTKNQTKPCPNILKVKIQSFLVLKLIKIHKLD